MGLFWGGESGVFRFSGKFTGADRKVGHLHLTKGVKRIIVEYMEWWHVIVIVVFLGAAAYGLFIVIKILAKNPRSVVPKSDLKEELVKLHRFLPQPPTEFEGTYRVSKELKRELRKTKMSQESLQKVVDNICYFLGEVIPPKIIVSQGKPFHEESIFEPSESLGLYRSQWGYEREITLVKKLGMKRKHILAILAHECTHHYLNHHNFWDDNRSRNEILTDVSACYLGLGGLLLKGYGRIQGVGRKFANYVFGIRLGYVRRIDLLRTISISARLRENKDLATPLPLFRKLFVISHLDKVRRGRPLGRP